ncbi:uncharacterized protein A4U43_C01F1150 [Asparagus officinalis]|uniref:Purple acid phosphatase n=1 Tax=Asparagus officinalis TaxID=4686 RepID=A0A5P1FLG5_ASPOF|nr:uncharacterized protein A4U43_C01F1150 [Asparagus officinalis]
MEAILKGRGYPVRDDKVKFAALLLSFEKEVVFSDIVSSGVTSSYVRSEFPAVDIPIDSKEFAVPKDQNAPQQLHITQGDYNGKAVILSWVTFTNPGTNEVSYGESQNKYDHNAQGKTTNYTFYDYKSGYIHHCLIDGLEVTWGKQIIRFLLLSIICKVEDKLSSMLGTSHADRYECDNGTRWDSWGRLIERSAAYQPWFWAAGNHDIEYRPDLGEVSTFKAFSHIYATPHEASQSSSPLWYAIRRASAHIIMLSSYSPFVKYTPQWTWLQNELERVDRKKTPWLIVLMHLHYTTAMKLIIWRVKV